MARVTVNMEQNRSILMGRNQKSRISEDITMGFTSLQLVWIEEIPIEGAVLNDGLIYNNRHFPEGGSCR
jgi:hypothetical protein